MKKFEEFREGMLGRAIGSVIGGAVAGTLGIETGPGDIEIGALGSHIGGHAGDAIEDAIKAHMSQNEDTSGAAPTNTTAGIAPSEKSPPVGKKKALSYKEKNVEARAKWDGENRDKLRQVFGGLM